MAKVGVWLRGARGKLAGNVLAKGEGGTVIRELVNPANPRTHAQMRQRVSFGTVTSASRYLKGIIGQTFEGASSVKMNRRMFVKKNSPLLLSKAKDIDNGIEANAYFKNAGSSYLIPNDYIISDGSLTQSVLSKVGWVNGEDWYFTGGRRSDIFVAPNGTVQLIEVFQKALKMTWNEQLTLVMIQNASNSQSSQEPPALTIDDTVKGGVIASSKMQAFRLVMKDIDNAPEAAMIVEDTTTGEQIWEQALEYCVDWNKTDARWASLLKHAFPLEVDVVPQTTHVRAVVFSGIGSDPDDHPIKTSDFGIYEGNVYSLATFISKIQSGVWRYSRSFFVTRQPSLNVEGYMGRNFGLNLTLAINSFFTEANASPEFTRAGGDENALIE